jgi:hypothetical protein
MSANGFGLCEEAVLKAQFLNLALLLIKKPNVRFSTKSAFSQNQCCLLVCLVAF